MLKTNSGEIIDICMLLEDPDERTRDHVKLFLHELNSKGNNKIYNELSNAFSRLSTEFAFLSKSEFENIAKNLLMYVVKDK
jgi:hypothetical protein